MPEKINSVDDLHSLSDGRLIDHSPIDDISGVWIAIFSITEVVGSTEHEIITSFVSNCENEYAFNLKSETVGFAQNAYSSHRKHHINHYYTHTAHRLGS